MLVLAIDTALDACAAAVLDTAADRVVSRETQSMNRGHAEALMPLLARVMHKSGAGFHDLDRVVSTVGPGSFTGLRVGLSAARGIALAANKPVVGVTTLASYAAPWISEDAAPAIISAIDARHNHVYFQIVGGDGAPMVAPCIIPIDEAVERAQLAQPYLVGNAAHLLAERWPKRAPISRIDSQPAPDIAWVAWLGAAADPAEAQPRPLYLRAPDAKPQPGLAPAEPPPSS